MPFTFKADSGELAPGQHNNVEIVEAVPGINAKGNENLRVVFEDDAGAQIADWLVFLPQVKWRWRQLWEAAGLDWPDQGGTVNENDLIGRHVAIEVIEDEYQGVTRPKVKEVFGVVPGDVPNDGFEQPVASGGFAAAAGLEDEEPAF